MQRSFFLFFLFTVFLFCSNVHGQTADELIAKNIESRGGLSKLRATKSFRISGRATVGQGMEAPFVLEHKRPNKLRIELVVQGLSEIEAYDGETAWYQSPLSGSKDSHKMPEERAKDLMLQADFDGALVDYKEKGHTVEYLGKEDVEGSEAHKLKVTLKGGSVRYVYRDPETGLELKVTSVIKREGFEGSVDTYLSDYKEVNGQWIPFFVEQKVKGHPSVQFSVDKVEMDVDLEDSRFAMPSAESKQTQPSSRE